MVEGAGCRRGRGRVGLGGGGRGGGMVLRGGGSSRGSGRCGCRGALLGCYILLDTLVFEGGGRMRAMRDGAGIY